MRAKAPRSACSAFQRGPTWDGPHSRHSLRTAPSRVTEAEIEVFEAWSATSGKGLLGHASRYIEAFVRVMDALVLSRPKPNGSAPSQTLEPIIKREAASPWREVNGSNMIHFSATG